MLSACFVVRPEKGRDVICVSVWNAGVQLIHIVEVYERGTILLIQIFLRICRDGFFACVAEIRQPVLRCVQVDILCPSGIEIEQVDPVENRQKMADSIVDMDGTGYRLRRIQNQSGKREVGIAVRLR